MKKYIYDFIVAENVKLSHVYALLKLRPSNGSTLPEIMPGQFVQVDIPDKKGVFLRRPISVNYVDYENNELWLLVRNAGKGTEKLVSVPLGQIINIVFPLGNGFSLKTPATANVLLIGGGVGVAPLLYLGKKMKDAGVNVSFLLGAKSRADLLELEEFNNYGSVYVSTDDGSFGENGVVTHNSALQKKWDKIYCCGPMPMMHAVASYALRNNIECEVSLENRMACGLGACLCCVEDTDRGNVCVCTEGPVFNIKKLKWQI